MSADHRGRRRRPVAVAAVVGCVLATAGSVHLALRTGGTDLLDGRTGPVLLVALPYLLLVLGVYGALFDHDEPSERPDPGQPPVVARED